MKIIAINKNIPEIMVIFRPNKKSVISSINLTPTKFYNKSITFFKFIYILSITINKYVIRY